MPGKLTPFLINLYHYAATYTCLMARCEAVTREGAGWDSIFSPVLVSS
ncbi:MAG: hypothetical protein ACLRXB_07755 [Escherichia coli]